MTHIDSMRRSAAMTGFVAVLASSGCALMETTVDEWNPPAPGSAFTRMETNTGSFGNGVREVKVSVGESTWGGTSVVAFSTAQGASLYRHNGRLVALLDKTGKPLVTWDPPDDGHGFRFPLSVGKTWTESARMTMPNGKVVPHENACRVEGREEVQVPAGTFMTFKVHCSSPRGLEITQWYAPEPGLIVKAAQTRTAKNPFGGAGTREDQLVAISLKR